jgi:hypothetical protein
MANGVSIAAVTAILKNIIEDGLVLNSALSSLGNILITTSPPDQISRGADDQPQLNLFLYQVSQNRNAEWIGRDRDHPAYQQAKALGLGQPTLAVNLHYLLTAYGSKDFQTELLLGYVMELMQQTPFISNEGIRTALNHVATINRSGLLSQAIASTSVATLAKHLGQLQITPDLFDTEQMSRLWSLLHSAYRPSIAYKVSMVFIGTQKPVVEAEVISPPGHQHTPSIQNRPHIERIVAAPSNQGEIVAGSSLIIYGKHLCGGVTRLCLNGAQPLLEPQIVEENRILFQLSQTIEAGMQQIQVVHQPRFKFQDDAPDVVSNEKTFMVFPSFDVSTPAIRESYSEGGS